MTNRCRIKTVQRKLYNVKDPPWGKDRKNREKEYCSNQNCTCNLFSWFIWTLAFSDKKFIHINTSYLCMIAIQFHINRCPIYYGLVLWPTLYKFIILDFLGLSPFILDWATNLVLTHTHTHTHTHTYIYDL